LDSQFDEPLVPLTEENISNSTGLTQMIQILNVPDNNQELENFEFESNASDSSQDSQADQDILPEPTGNFVPVTYSWTSFLREFASKIKYERRIENFYAYGDSNNYPRDIDGYFLNAEEVLHRYFEFSHLLMNEDNKPRYAPTSLRGWYSIFLKYWIHTGKGNIDTIAPIIDSDLVKWTKGYEEKKAKVFSKEQLGIKYYFITLKIK
jgi:hypothetical protein